MKKNFLVFILLFCATINLFSQGHEQHFMPDTAFLNNVTPCGITPEILKKLDVDNETYNPKTLPTAFPGYAIISCGKFDIYYEDLILTNPQVGFSDPVNGVARRNTLCAVLNYVQSVFDFSNIPSASPIRLHVNESFAPVANPAPPGTGFLAFAGPTFINNATPGIIKGFVHDYASTGIDPATVNQYHAELTVNFHQTTAGVIQWQNDHTVLPISNCFYDLYSVLLHEIGHTLGWLSYIHHSGSGTPESFLGNNQYSGIDEFLHIGANNYPLSLNPLLVGAPSSPSINPLYASSQTVLTDNEVWINSLAAPNNDPVYSGLLVTSWPQSFSISSILSHLDDQMWVYSERSRISPGNSKDYVMGPFGVKGILRRTFQDIEINTLLNLGYAINPSFLSNTLTNSPPFSTRMASYTNFLDNDFPESVAPDFPPLVNNTGASLVINLATDPTIVDAEGDPIFVSPGTLVNIRGCGNGGNNHNSLTVTSTPAGDIITYTPRANFYGRAQFGLRLFDGKEEGSYVIYTIDVLKGTNVSCSSGSNLVLNGDFEEGTEVKRLGAEEIIEASSSEQAFLREGKLRAGIHFGDCHPYNYISNNWGPFGAGDIINDSYIICNGSIYTSQAGAFTTTFPFGGSAPNPTAANGVGERYRRIYGPFTYFNLCSDAEQCKRYILEFDYFTQPANTPTGTNIPLTIAFTNNTTFFPTLPTYTFSFTHNFIANSGSWQHITIPFTYCGNTPAGILSLVQTTAWLGFFIDNLELKEDLSPQPPLSVSITPTSPTICAGNSVSLVATVNNDLCNVTYSWSPALGLSCTNCPNPVASPSATTTYTLTVNDGCSTVTDQITVNVDNTCCTANNNIIVGTYNNLTLNFPGGPYAIQGNIVLTGTCNFSNADISISDNVSITVSPGCVLTINGFSRLYSCNSMWDGIIVQPGGQLIIAGGLFRPVIEDAKAAVVSVNGADVRLSNCDLNRNLVGVYFTAFTGVHPAVIGPRVNITTVNSLIPTNNIQTATLDDPSLNPNGSNRTLYGIYIPAGNGTLNIGVNNVALAQRNVFDNMDFGIHANAINLTVNCNTFRNIRGPVGVACFNFPNCPPEIGTAIYATTKEVRNISIGTTTQFNNDFTNCRIGIHTFDYNNTSILHNTFTAPVLGSNFSQNGIRAVEVINNANFFPNITVNINNNTITDYTNAIRYTFTNMAIVNNTTLNINQNNIRRTLNKVVNGIIVQNLVPPSGQSIIGTNNWNVNQNTFPLFNTNPNSPLYSLGITNGIQMLNIQGVISNVGANNINITQGGNRTGIRVSNCNNLTVQSNTVRGTGITAAEINHRGIWASLSPKCTFKCNSLQTTGQALVFEGMCITANILSVVGNTINNAFRGLILQNSGEIGQQGSNTLYSDNRWLGTFTDFQTYVASTANANTASRLFVRSTPAAYRPTNHGELIPFQAYLNGIGIFDYTGGSAYLCPVIVLPGPPVNPLLRSLARNEPNYDDDTRWISRYGLYNAINKDLNLAQQDPVLDSFYVAEQSGFYGQLKQVYEHIADSNYAAAWALNNSLNPLAQAESNYHLYNTIAIRLAAGDSLTAADVNNLLYIAEQCPFTGGAIVYQARAFINFIYPEEIDFEDICPEQRQAFETDNEKTYSQDIKLYPNPNAGEFTLLYDAEATTPVLEVYDISGKLLLQQNLPQGGRCEIKLNHAERGIYLYKVYSDKNLLGTGKVEIVK